MELSELSSEEWNKLFTNPFYCLPQIDEAYCQLHEPAKTRNEWILLNKQLALNSTELWLGKLLLNLKIFNPGEETANPYACLNKFSQSIFVTHEPLVTKDRWISVNIKIMKETGFEKWADLLLDNLEGYYLANEDYGPSIIHPLLN